MVVLELWVATRSCYPHRLGFACQEVQDPITEGGAEPKVSELGDELGGHNGVKC